MKVSISEMTVTNRIESKLLSNLFDAHNKTWKICTGYYYIFCFVKRVSLNTRRNIFTDFPEFFFLCVTVGEENFSSLKIFNHSHYTFCVTHQNFIIVAIEF